MPACTLLLNPTDIPIYDLPWEARTLTKSWFVDISLEKTGWCRVFRHTGFIRPQTFWTDLSFRNLFAWLLPLWWFYARLPLQSHLEIVQDQEHFLNDRSKESQCSELNACIFKTVFIFKAIKGLSRLVFFHWTPSIPKA